MAAGFSFSYSPAGASSPLVGVNPAGQVTSPYGAFSIAAIANQLGGTQQGQQSTGRIQDPALAKSAPVPSPLSWLLARPLILVGGLVGVVALIWIAKRRKKG